MQCDDGGWGAFDRNNNKAILNHIPFADFNALLDPSTSDVTGRCLEFLGRIGFSKTYVNIRKAVEFLKEQRKRRFVVWALGSKLYLWHVVCACRTSGGRRGYEQAHIKRPLSG